MEDIPLCNYWVTNYRVFVWLQWVFINIQIIRICVPSLLYNCKSVKCFVWYQVAPCMCDNCLVYRFSSNCMLTIQLYDVFVPGLQPKPGEGGEKTVCPSSETNSTPPKSAWSTDPQEQERPKPLWACCKIFSLRYAVYLVSGHSVWTFFFCSSILESVYFFHLAPVSFLLDTTLANSIDTFKRWYIFPVLLCIIKHWCQRTQTSTNAECSYMRLRKW